MEKDWVSKFTSKYDEIYYDHVSEKNEFPEDFFSALGADNRFGLLVSNKNGGSEISFSEFVQNILDMSRRAGTLTYYFVAQNLSAKLFDDHGTEKLRSLLPEVMAGKAKVNLALTEEQSGADALSINTEAVQTGDGNYSITGDKYCVTNGKGADYLMVAARTSPPSDKKSHGLTTFVITEKQPAKTSFVSLGKMGLNFLPLYSVSFNGVKVSRDAVLGEIDRAWSFLSRTFAADRLALGAMFVGMGRMALDRAAEYAREREVFGRKIGSNQGIQFPLARAFIELSASEAYILRGSEMMDNGEIDRNRDIPMGAYYHSVNAASMAIDAALQTLGASGYLSGFVEKLYRDIRYYRMGPISEQLALVSIAERTLNMPGAKE
ncbi:hypothetical protein IX51_02980 [uncultured archaeon]|nr:hypothetical protein IX51_02980 [uncultured archaeon]